MTRYVCPGAASLSEFVGLPTHEYGDCGPDATLMALHAAWPTRYALSPYGLGSIDASEQAHGYAASNGAQNIPSMDAYLTSIGVAHRTTGYAQFTLDALHTTLESAFSASGCSPVIVETSAAGAGLPDDEAGVQYHFFCVAGVDDQARTPDGFTGGYLRLDGDSRTDSPSGATTAPIVTSWAEIAASKPVAFIVLEGTVQAVSWTLEHDAAGAISGAHDAHGAHVGAGMATLINDRGWLGSDALIGERYLNATESAAALINVAGRSQVLYYSPSTGVTTDHAGDVVAALFALLDTAATAAKNLQAQLDALKTADAQEESTETTANSADAALGAAIRAALVGDGFSHK